MDGGQPFATYCPHCQVELKLQSHLAGQAVNCPNCGGGFQAPDPRVAPTYTNPAAYPAQLEPGIKICILISGVANILSGLFWTSTVCGAIVGVPQIVLAIFEFVFFAQADKKPVHEALDQAKVYGILEIVSGLINLVSLVCGILVLVFSSNQNSKGY